MSRWVAISRDLIFHRVVNEFHLRVNGKPSHDSLLSFENFEPNINNRWWSFISFVAKSANYVSHNSNRKEKNNAKSFNVRKTCVFFEGMLGITVQGITSCLLKQHRSSFSRRDYKFSDITGGSTWWCWWWWCREMISLLVSTSCDLNMSRTELCTSPSSCFVTVLTVDYFNDERGWLLF